MELTFKIDGPTLKPGCFIEFNEAFREEDLAQREYLRREGERLVSRALTTMDVDSRELKIERYEFDTDKANDDYVRNQRRFYSGALVGIAKPEDARIGDMVPYDALPVNPDPATKEVTIMVMRNPLEATAFYEASTSPIPTIRHEKLTFRRIRPVEGTTRPGAWERIS